MSTTSLYVELVVIGAQVLAWSIDSIDLSDN